MKKWTAITDGGKYGVQPTMEKPLFNREYFSTSEFREYRQNLANWVIWDEHLLTLPRYLRTQGLELLPDGEEFAGEIGYQVRGLDGGWMHCDKEKYDSELDSHRRSVLTPPIFYCKEWDNVGYQCDEQCDKCKKADNLQEPVLAPLVKDQPKDDVGIIAKLLSRYPSGIIVGAAAAIVGDCGLTIEGANQDGTKWQKRFNPNDKINVTEIRDNQLVLHPDGIESVLSPLHFKGVQFQYPKDEAPKSEPVEQEGCVDFQEQIKRHIREYKMFDWHEALTENEMTYLVDLMLTFSPDRWWESLKQSDAVEFAKWLVKNAYGCEYVGTPEELYKIFTTK